MNVERLIPKPLSCESFLRSRERFVSPLSGCYVLTNFQKEILYLGLATNLRKRMNNHLDSLAKTLATQKGKAVHFFWLEHPEVNKLERTWMNMHIQEEGELPVLNSFYSPVST